MTMDLEASTKRHEVLKYFQFHDSEQSGTNNILAHTLQLMRIRKLRLRRASTDGYTVRVRKVTSQRIGVENAFVIALLHEAHHRRSYWHQGCSLK
jgi:hypothetical protein